MDTLLTVIIALALLAATPRITVRAAGTVAIEPL
jgi:hypothetical protein